MIEPPRLRMPGCCHRFTFQIAGIGACAAAVLAAPALVQTRDHLITGNRLGSGARRATTKPWLAQLIE